MNGNDTYSTPFKGNPNTNNTTEPLHNGDSLRVKPFIVPYPGQAGATVTPPPGDSEPDNTNNNPFAPFTQMDWYIARWAKLRGPGSTAFTELLAIDGVCIILFSYKCLTRIMQVRERLGISYSNT